MSPQVFGFEVYFEGTGSWGRLVGMMRRSISQRSRSSALAPEDELVETPMANLSRLFACALTRYASLPPPLAALSRPRARGERAGQSLR